MNLATELPPANYEPRDASPMMVALTIAGVAAGVALTLLVAWFLQERHNRVADLAAAPKQTSFQGSSRMQPDVAQDWMRQDAAVQEHLQTYGWIDRGAGTVRIPIDRAMQLMAEESKPANRGGAK
jgi:hypothetical protein